MIRRLTSVAVPLAILAIAGCGSSKSSSSSATGASGGAAATTAASSSTSSAAAPAPSGAGTKLALSASKTGALAYNTKSLTAKAGKVTITFTNGASVPHNVTVQSGTSGPTIAATPTFSGGTKTITMTLKAGRYTYYCSVPGHRQAGMLGTLTVS